MELEQRNMVDEEWVVSNLMKGEFLRCFVVVLIRWTFKVGTDSVSAVDGTFFLSL